MAEAIGYFIGTIIAWLVLFAIPGVPIWLFVRSRKKRKNLGVSRRTSSTQSSSAGAQAPAGWYPDVTAGNALRWWDGTTWGIFQSEQREGAYRTARGEVSDPTGRVETLGNSELNQPSNETCSAPPTEDPAEVERDVTRQRPAKRSASTAQESSGAKKISRGSKTEWIPAGRAIEVNGYVIPGGMLYVGRHQSFRGTDPEPSLIDPSLRTDGNRPDYAGQSLSYWPSYHRISAEARAAYLDWLSRGRRDPNVPIGYVFLFMYGLERRVLTEIAGNPKLAHELPAIRNEMQELMALHQDEYSFQSYGSGFLSILELLELQADSNYQFEPPPLDENRWSFPMGLKVELGSLAADGKPVGAEWALAWAWFHPGTRIRTPATRCPNEFSAVFKSLYTEAHGRGLVPKPTKRKVKFSYDPASAAIPRADVSMDGISDVSEAPTITRELELLADQAQGLLDSYSRFIGKNPHASTSLKAQALLPPEVLDPASQALGSFLNVLAFATSNSGTVSAAELIAMWNGSAIDRLPKSESIQLCQLAERLGFGLEPDPRFGGSVLQSAFDVAVFPTEAGAPKVATPEFTAALTLTHLAVAVSKADGRVLEEEIAALLGHVESSLGLTGHEGARIEAHARWLEQAEVKLTGLTKRVASLSGPQRDSLGILLVEIAAVDGVVRPDEVRTINKIYRLLGLDEGLVTSRLHQAVTGSTISRDEPVTVRPAEQGDPGSPIPARPSEPAPGFALNKASIDAKMRDTAAVSALLANIFEEESAVAPTGSRVAAPRGTSELAASPEVPSVAGLDAIHTELFNGITRRPAFSREEFDTLCETLGLLPNGALDTLNEAALEVCDEPLIDGEDQMTINAYALEEMLR